MWPKIDTQPKNNMWFTVKRNLIINHRRFGCAKIFSTLSQVCRVWFTTCIEIWIEFWNVKSLFNVQNVGFEQEINIRIAGATINFFPVINFKWVMEAEREHSEREQRHAWDTVEEEMELWQRLKRESGVCVQDREITHVCLWEIRVREDEGENWETYRGQGRTAMALI